MIYQPAKGIYHMAITGDNSNTNNTNAQPTSGVNFNTNQQFANSKPNNGGFTSFYGNSLGLSRTNRSAVLSTTYNTFIEFLKTLPSELKEAFTIKLLEIEKSIVQVCMSAIVVAIQHKQDDKNVVYDVTLIADSADPFAPKISQDNANTIELKMPDSVAWDNDYMEKVAQVLKTAYPNANCFCAGSQVIPRNTDMVKDLTIINSLISNSLMACLAVRANKFSQNIEPNLAAIKQTEEFIVSVKTTGQSQVTDYAGYPVWAPYRIQLDVSPINAGRSNNMGSLNRINATKQIGLVTGGMDFIYAPNNSGQNNGMLVNQDSRKFRPRFIITGMEAAEHLTVGTQLLMLFASRSIQQNNGWMSHFVPKANAGKTIDLADIGALNIDGNLERSPTEFGEIMGLNNTTEFINFVNRLVYPEVVYTLRVSDCGADSWYNNVFVAAARGDGDAINHIIKVANDITGGEFGKLWNTNNRPVWINDDKDIMGYYTDSNGQQRDLTSINYLAVQNVLGQRDKQIGIDWDKANNDFNVSSPVRMHHRNRIRQQVVQTEITYTGYCTLVTFDPAFINAFCDAVRATGVVFRSSNDILDFNTQRPNSPFANAGVGMQNGIFTSGGKASGINNFFNNNNAQVGFL